MIVAGTFDPITRAEVEKILALYRSRDGVFVVSVNGEGILPIELRQQIVEEVFRPYRHIYTASGLTADLEIEPVDEEEVRSGHFDKAAKGSLRLLRQENCYLEQTLDAMCNEKRAAHSRSVAQVCMELGAANGLDLSLCFAMGMLHDVTKRFDQESGEAILKNFAPALVNEHPAVYHGYTAAIWLRAHQRVFDRRVLHAVHHHVKGEGRTAYDRVLYIADKCEPTRGYDTSFQTDLARRDLKAAAHLVKEESRAYILKTEGKHV